VDDVLGRRMWDGDGGVVLLGFGIEVDGKWGDGMVWVEDERLCAHQTQTRTKEEHLEKLHCISDHQPKTAYHIH